MRRFFVFVISLSLLFGLSVHAFALEGEGSDDDSEPLADVVSDVPSDSVDSLLPVLSNMAASLEILANYSPVITYSFDDLRDLPVVPSEPLTGFKAFVVSIFGEYEPVITTSLVKETVGDSVQTTLVDVVASGFAGVDFVWLAGVLLFAILLHGFFRIVGGLLR